MRTSITIIAAAPLEATFTNGYRIGGVICLFILAYLVYSLIKPEKF